MSNEQHAIELDALAEMYPQGDVYAALRAGAAALRSIEGAKTALRAEAWKINQCAPVVGLPPRYRLLSNDQDAVCKAYLAAVAILEAAAFALARMEVPNA